MKCNLCEEGKLISKGSLSYDKKEALFFNEKEELILKIERPVIEWIAEAGLYITGFVNTNKVDKKGMYVYKFREYFFSTLKKSKE